MQAGLKRIPLVDLQAQHSEIRNELLAAVIRVADSQKFILGDDVKLLEADLAGYCGARYAIGCASGSDALLLALLALEIGPGDEVLTTPYTFFATAGAISEVGATPVFVDVEEQTFNLDVSRLAGVLDRHPKIRALIPVHLFGGCADMDPIRALAEERGIAVIEDAAQSIGSEYKGQRAGSLGKMAAFSFYPTKNLGAWGDGGMVTTSDESLAQRLRALRVHGRTGTYLHQWIGVNSRLDTMQAAVLRVKLPYLDAWSAIRQRNAGYYRGCLRERAVPVVAPEPAAYQTRHVYNQFVIRCGQRDALAAWLREQGIGTDVYYPVPLHLQPCYAGLGYGKGAFPVSERLAAESLALPVHANLAQDDVEYICDCMAAFYRSES